MMIMKYEYICVYNAVLNDCKSYFRYYNMLSDQSIKKKPDKPRIFSLPKDDSDDNETTEVKQYLTVLMNANPNQIVDLEEQFDYYQNYIKEYIFIYGIKRAACNKHITNPQDIGYPGTYWMNLIQ